MHFFHIFSIYCITALHGKEFFFGKISELFLIYDVVFPVFLLKNASVAEIVHDS